MPNTHSVTIGLYIKAGVGYSEPMHGITHLLEHLHFRQLGDTTQDTLYYQMESIGSTLRATTYRDFLSFSMKIVPCYFDKAMQIFVNLVSAAEWQKDHFEKEKQVVCNQISEEGTYLVIDDEARKCVFRNHPLARPIMGTAESVMGITPEDATEYKKRVFTADNVYFCVTGNFTTANKAYMLEKLSFCSLSAPGSFLMEYPLVFHHRKPDVVFQYTNDNSPLDVNMSFDLCTEQDDPRLLEILNCILGEGVGSQLQRQIRERKCYSANITSYIEWYQNFGVLHIRFSVEKHNLYACIQEVVYVLQNLK
jgi:predicted Zn-dependent peptidase